MNFRSMWKSAHPICFSRNNYTERAAQNSVGSQALPSAYEMGKMSFVLDTCFQEGESAKELASPRWKP